MQALIREQQRLAAQHEDFAGNKVNSSKQCSKKLPVVNLYSLPAGFHRPWVEECTRPGNWYPEAEGRELNALLGKGEICLKYWGKYRRKYPNRYFPS